MLPTPAPVSAEPSPYGWREVPFQRPDGSFDYREEPLPRDAFLDPQEGDHLIQGTEHGACVTDLFVRLRRHYRHDPTVAVYSDLKIRWGIPGLKEPAPDITVVPNIRDPRLARQSFNVPAEGTRPSLVIEVVSPYQDGDDTDKVEIYRRAGIAEYLIVETFDPVGVIRYSIKGHRLLGGRYHPIRPDARGLLLSQTTGLDFGVEPDQRGIVIIDVASGQPLLGDEMLIEQWLDERQRREQEAELRQQAEARAARYRLRLQELGIDPDA